ncbi:UPF0481 protein At3g47200-like [Durio zibethinus]|uniref:UPF0481 protein At3g47200-like n=1 Tax=Durio zibethinus TaxID=66656 RepID=A0A6P5Z556_DURZI|nr:UPF0481 protein At3g47200-like [Durio zibethinus]XP_022747715.1 UPF0481 protein At3g47200-like [Durio zibethinus]XP_022747717.1 UPF0481 protein At3g47200-like [Durio zibethinus]
MASIIQLENRETEEETNGSLRKELLDEGDIVESEREEHFSDSVKDWEINIKNLINNQRCPNLSRPCCIYRAHVLRDVDCAAFTPKIISIGPLHRFQKHLKGMNETKIKCLHKFLEHAAKTARLHEQQGLTSLEELLSFLGSKEIDHQIERANDFSCLDNFLGILKSLENDIRGSYGENLNDIGSEEFVRLILVDAAFIIELFLGLHFQSYWDTFQPPTYLLVFIRNDLWLLENQLPFFVLEELYNSAFRFCPDIYPPFLELSINVFKIYNDQNKESITFTGKVNHFTDLLRAFLLPSSGNFQDKEQNSISENQLLSLEQHLPSATHLHAAGVKFCATESKCLLDIKFSNGRLEIPSLHLWDETGIRFRNIIALEQYHYPQERIISDYFTLMDYLVDTSDDADLLVGKKIIKHWLGSSNEVASLFNSLCVNILKGLINPSFFHLIEELNKYHDQPWHSWKAALRSQYFSTPWRSASTTAAIILLVLTLAQTLLAAFSIRT